MIDKPSRAVLFEFFTDLQLSQAAESKGTGPANVRKGLRNAVQYLNLSILQEDLDSAVIKAVAGRPESKGQSATVDKATMSAFHQVNMELIGAGLTPSVATEGESAGFTWGTSPSWKLAPAAHWPEGGLSPQGVPYEMARLRLQTELAGACFSPDGNVLFLNVFSPTRTLAITGAWEGFVT